MKKTGIGTLLYLLLALPLIGQSQLTQTVRGTVVDIESKSPLPGVTIIIPDIDKQIVTISDSEGYFKLENVPIGRKELRALLIGYDLVILRDLEIKSGKELVLTIEMRERIEDIEEVVITGNRKDKAINEMAMVSARSFTVEETERYAGTWLDPARMASNYAGVMTTGDQRNDIIIRGNSPLGLLWKLEGVSIPNPNHFGTLGTTGGPISILNNNVLDNSDFFTGAFPAEYGNALSGVFDLNMRKGNNETYEFTAQAGMNGLEFGAEGPFKKNKKSSFLLNYRYSTLAIFDLLDIHFGVSGVPEYQDISFNFNYVSKNAGTFSVFGVGGISTIEVFFEDRKENDWSFGRNQLDFKFGSGMGAAGISHFYSINKKSYLKSVIAVSGTLSSAKADSAYTETEVIYYGDKSNEKKYSYTSKYVNKLNVKNSFTAGLIVDMYDVHYEDSVLLDEGSYFYLSEVSNQLLILPAAYAQFKHRFSNKLSITWGTHFLYFNLNNKTSLEPRIALKYEMNPKHTLSAGAGIHSQLQPRLFYFQKTVIDDIDSFTNKNLDFTKSNQVILSYDWLIHKNLRLKLESYYQYLNNVPVEETPSTFSMINYGTSFFEERTDSLVNTGIGENYGIEITFEKFLSKNYYFLFTSSIFESNYTASDKIKRNTIYNGNYVFNFLSGYTFKTGKYSSINLDIKTVYAGGKHYIPVDLEASSEAGMKVLNYDEAFEHQFDDYFRLDGRVGFQLNMKKYHVELAFDVQNLTGQENVLLQTYDVESNSIVYDYQLGLFYVFFIRFQF